VRSTIKITRPDLSADELRCAASRLRNDVVNARNFGLALKSLKGLVPYEFRRRD